MNNFDIFRFIFGDTSDSSYNEPFARDGSFGEHSCEDHGIDSIFLHFQSDMQQHMEEIQNQMKDMMESFGAVEFSNIHGVEFPTSDVPGSSNGNLRDEMLKSPEGPPLGSQIPSHSPSENKSFFEGFGLPSLNLFSSPKDEIKVDQDLDGKEIDVLKDLGSSQCLECPKEKDLPSNSFFHGQSVTVRSVQGPDGKVEQWRTVQDTSGRKEETCTRFVDGKMHTITHKVDDKGNEEKVEEFKNMDESDLSSFNKSWNTPRIGTFQPEHPADTMMAPQPRQDSYLGSIFSKLFGYKP